MTRMSKTEKNSGKNENHCKKRKHDTIRSKIFVKLFEKNFTKKIAFDIWKISFRNVP
jgi:hypothetical protein